KSIKHLDEIGGSQVLFIAPSEARRVVDIIAWVNGKAILTIGDTKEFGAKGVIINFFITKQESMGFEINREASQKARLKIPSQLFAIGKLVKTDPPPLQAKKMGEQEK
ncbi:MAG: YfiR family protein, partial [bacterium]|nr:YfiR family protein [bacterium]